MPAGGGHAVHASSASSAGNQVELVAIGVSERGPPGRARGDLVDDGGSEVQQSLDVGGEVGADQVGVEPVLDAVGLGDPMEGQAGPELGCGGIDGRVVDGSPLVDRPVENRGPELSDAGSVSGVECGAEEGRADGDSWGMRWVVVGRTLVVSEVIRRFGRRRPG